MIYSLLVIPVKTGIFFLYGLLFGEIPACAEIVNVHNFDDGIKSIRKIEMLEDSVENKFGFEAERLEVCSAAKRMFAVFSTVFQYLAIHIQE